MIEYRNEIPTIESYWPLFSSTGWNDIYRMETEAVEVAITNSTFAVCAYSGEQLIGFARAVSDSVLYATVYDVIVLPAFRKQGIGSELVRRITGTCTDAGVATVHLFAAKGTEPFYQRLGYKVRPAGMSGMYYHPEKS